ncbi:MAG: uridine diphosphate-N-acetylglucosamine-binding protein YvcK [Actinomycetaceae bacterium]|nr:uridine diphosphate-N-acetylglucosamine-binding protein YvcK [Actinomycetaceae bacterium]
MERGVRGPKVVALGGGHGLAATLSALRLITTNLTAIVTVADDGGSSGRLRKEFGVLPPGDLRMALSALCDSSEWGQTWRDILQHRFTSDGPLDGHAVGNLLILGLWERLGDTVSALDWVGELLQVKGRVLPMSSMPLEIRATVRRGEDCDVVQGQVAVATARGKVEHIELIPHNPPAQQEALEAIEDADWVVFGPGSWFTSVIPHLLVPDLREALEKTTAKKLLSLNLLAEKETSGMNAGEHVSSFREYAPQLGIDIVLADPSAVDSIRELDEKADQCGARVLLRQVRMGDGSPRHDPLRLAAAYRDAFDKVLGDVLGDAGGE